MPTVIYSLLVFVETSEEGQGVFLRENTGKSQSLEHLCEITFFIFFGSSCGQ